ncbi:hypothetical protein Hanom_Chr04g00356411 [Helianthus anomalus]
MLNRSLGPAVSDSVRRSASRTGSLRHYSTDSRDELGSQFG